MPEALALADLLRQAGAVLTRRGGRPVPAHYGSPAGELAVCVAGVGLAERSDLAVISIAAGERGLDQLLVRVLGHEIAPGGAVLDGGVWWCRAASGIELLAICPGARAQSLKVMLHRDVGRLVGGTLTDLSDARLVLNVVGRRTAEVLAELGVYGPDANPRTTQPFTEVPVAGQPVSWLLEADTGAYAIVDASRSGEVWRAIEAAGRASGITCVGIEAVERYALTERGRRGNASL